MWSSVNKQEGKASVTTLMIKVAKIKHDFIPMTSDGEVIV